MADMNNVEPVGADPCAALFGSAKTDCEKLRNQGSGSSGSSGGSIWDFFTNPVELEGGIRHLFLRTAEVLIGGLLVIVGLNALIKAQTNVNVVGTTTKLAKNTVKAAVK